MFKINFAHGGAWGSNAFGYMGMRGFGGSIFGWIMMLLFVGPIVKGILYLIKNMKNNSDNSRKTNNYRQIDYKGEDKKDPAREIARQRYTKAEISKEELNEILSEVDQ